MSVFAFRLEAIAWLLSTVYLFTHAQSVASWCVAFAVYIGALVKAFNHPSQRFS